MIALYILGAACLYYAANQNDDEARVANMAGAAIVLILAELWRYFLP